MVNGLPQVTAILDVLEKSGHLINPYTPSYMSDKDDNNFSVDAYQVLIDEHGSQFAGHLLIIYTGNEIPDEYNQLPNLYPPLGKIVKEDLQKGRA